MVTYRLRQLSLVPDKYGQHLAIKMVSKYEDGKFVKHVKINDELIKELHSSTVVKGAV